MIQKTGRAFFFNLNSHRRYFGATDFVVKLANLDTNQVSTIAASAPELMETVVTPHSATMDVATAKGSVSLVVAAGSNMADGEVFTTQAGDMYYIESVAGNIITLKYPLVAPLSFGDALTQVGNLGIYNVEILIGVAGTYSIMIENPGINMRLKAIQCSVQDVVVGDISDQMADNFADITTQLGEISASVSAASDSAEFTVYSA